jgi:hypothetical protein
MRAERAVGLAGAQQLELARAVPTLLEIFTKAENASARFKKAGRLKCGANAADTTLAVYSPEANLGLWHQTLYRTMK